MSRDLASVITSNIGNTVINPFFTVDMEFDSGTLHIWTGQGTTTIDSNVYAGVGSMINISQIGETSEIAAKGMSLSMSGLPDDILSAALTEPYHGRICTLYMGMMEDPTVHSEIFSGYMNQMTIDEDESVSTITLAVESRLIELERPRVRRYTGSYHKTVYPGDLGFDFVESMIGKETLWGKTE